MRAHKIRKKRNVCRKNPTGEGHPESEAIVTNEPRTLWRSLYVSGFATKKNTNVE